MKKTIFVSALALLFSFSAQAQERSGELSLWMDYAAFSYETLDKAAPESSAFTYLEIYYALDRKELYFNKTDSGSFAIVDLNLSLLDSKSQEIESRNWKIASVASPLEEVSGRSFLLYDLVPFRLLPGRYNLNLTATDLYSQKKAQKKLELVLPDFHTTKLCLSDIQLAMSLNPDTTRTKFTKAFHKVIPNPLRLVSSQDNILYFYAEVYNLSSGPAADSFNVSYSILDTLANPVKDYGLFKYPKPGKSSTLMSGLNISSLAGGKYFLNINITDPTNQKSAFARKEFSVVRPKPVIEEEASGPNTLEEAKLMRDYIQYIASEEDLKMYDQLTLDGKKTFLKQFWQKKDPNPQTPQNEFKIEHFRRFAYANENYSVSLLNKTGWKSDMGRIYIKYGTPDDIEKHPYAGGQKPWEKWIYNQLDGGTYFIFVDDQGWGEYKLIHASNRKEAYNPDWERLLELPLEQID